MKSIKIKHTYILLCVIFIIMVFSSTTIYGADPLPLEGKVIVANPGHGWRYVSSSTWGYERTTTYGVTEDIHNAYRISYFLGYVNVNGGGVGLSPRDTAGVHQYDYNTTSSMFHKTWPYSTDPNQPRYRISPRYVLKDGYNPLGRGVVPSTVYNSSYASTEKYKTWRARVYYNNWVYDQTHSSNVLYLAFHSNAGGGSARGMDTYIGVNTTESSLWSDYDGKSYQSVRAYWVPKAKVLGPKIHNRTIQLVKDYWDSGVIDRGIHQTTGVSYELTKPKNMSILIEHFFHDNATEAEWLKTPKFQKLLAQGAYKGICDYYGVDYNLPTAITDLQATSGPQSNQIILSWTATGEAGDKDFTNVAYLVKYSSSPILTDVDFNNATTYAQSWVPKGPGEPESYTLTMPGAGDYYIVIKAKNWTDDWSRLSNGVYISISGSGGSGGGGSSSSNSGIIGFIYNESTGLGNVSGNRISGVECVLSNVSGYLATNYSDSSGKYTFTNLLAGDYTVIASASGFTPNSKNIVVNSNSIAWGSIGLLAVGSNNNGGIIGFIYNESTGLGNVPENRISGVKCILSNTSGYLSTNYSDSSGKYTFANLSSGNYTVIASITGFIPNSKNLVVNSETVWGSIGLSEDSSTGSTNTNQGTGTNVNVSGTDTAAVIYAAFEKFEIQNKIFTPGSSDIDYDSVVFQFTDGGNPYNISIYNIRGELVADDTVVIRDKESGEAVVRWNGRDKNGSLVSSGVYFYFIRIEGELKRGSIVVCK